MNAALGPSPGQHFPAGKYNRIRCWREAVVAAQGTRVRDRVPLIGWVAGLGVFALIVLATLVWMPGRTEPEPRTEVAVGDDDSVADPDADTSTAAAPQATMNPEDEPGGVQPGADPDGGGGSLEPVPVEPLVVNEPIGLDDVGDFPTGVAVRVVEIEPVDGEAETRFEVAGRALRVTLEVENTSDGTVPLARLHVDVSHGEDRTPGMVLSGPGVVAFPEALEPGERSRGAVVYRVPPDSHDQVQVVVMHGPEAPVVVFEGSAPYRR
jgi:hypothetical protein